MQKKTRYWVHSCYSKTKEKDAVIVKEKIITYEDEDNSVIDIKDNLKVFENPKRFFWLTKPQCRLHKYKKEFEFLDNLDCYSVKNFELKNQIFKKLNIKGNPFKMSLRDMCDSPYIYGADIDIQVLIKQAYLDNRHPTIVPKLTTGSFDIETSVLGCERINIISFIHETKIYVAILDDFLYYYPDGTTRTKASLEYVKQIVNENLKKEIEEYNFEIEYRVSLTELDMITWIYEKIHYHKTDFIGIWNEDYDIPKIIERINANGGSILSIVCDPNIKEEFKQFKYYHDPGRPGEHFTDKWHWVNCTSQSQFYDAQLLWSRLRKISGREPSYSLDAIANKEGFEGKLPFGEMTTHYQMQKYNFPLYIAYNIKDSMLIKLMEWKNNDVRTLTSLVGNSLLSDFSKQTVMLKNRFYKYCKDRNVIPASAGAHMTTELDDLIDKFGGAVLSPNRMKNIGLNILSDLDIETLFFLFVSDLDVNSMYPNVTSGFNISKETKYATGVTISGKKPTDVEKYFSRISSPRENAVPLARYFFNLPGYEKMSKLFKESLHNV